MIRSRNNPRVKELARLRRRRERDAAGLALAEGPHLAREALAAGAPVRTLLLSDRARAHPEAEACRARAEAAGAEILEMTHGCYEKISTLGSPEGIGVVLRTARRAMDTLLVPDARLVVACGVQDPGNAGAIVRTAEAAGASGCLFLGGVDAWHPRFLRATMGSAFRLAVAEAGESAFLEARGGVRLLAADACAGEAEAVSFEEADYAPPVALCLGSEGEGLPPALRHAATRRIFIPMRKPVESLNVAVAAALLLYAARRQWSSAGAGFTSRGTPPA